MSRTTKGRIYKRGSIYWLQYYVNGEEKRQSLDTGNKKKAEKERNKILKPIQLGTQSDKIRSLLHALDDTKKDQEDAERQATGYLTIKNTWDAFKKSSNRPDTGKETLIQYSFQWNAFTKWLAESHSEIIKLVDLKPSIAEEYASFLKMSSLSAGTVNKHINLCKLVTRTLANKEGIKESPFANIQSLKSKQNHRKEFTWEKLCEICSAAEGETKILLFLGIYTGLRLGDCCLIKWSEIDLIQRWIKKEPSKTATQGNDTVQIKISQDLYQFLIEVPKDKREEYLLPEFATRYRIRRDLVTDIIQKLFVDCDVQIYKSGTGPGTGKRAILQYGFHSLRHTFVSFNRNAGVSQSVVMAMVGQRTRAVNDNYTHVGNDAIGEAIDRLPSIGDSNGQPYRLDKGKEIERLLHSITHENCYEIKDKILQLL